MDNENKSQQLAIVYEAFYDSPKTMKEVDVLTGIMRENICRHCATLRKSDRIYPVGERRCSITGHEGAISCRFVKKRTYNTRFRHEISIERFRDVLRTREHMHL